MTPEGHPEKFNIGTPWHTQDAFEAAMKYRSPVEIIMEELETKIENDIMTAVQSYGITVDKEELIKALQYDRKQYEKGFADAREKYKRPKGEWFNLEQDGRVSYPFWERYECSECHRRSNNSNFCPHCGAEMHQPEEEDYE